MAFNEVKAQLNVQINTNLFQNENGNSENIMQGGCTRPPRFRPLPVGPPIFIDPPRCGGPIFRIPPGEIPPRCGLPSEDAVPKPGKLPPFIRDIGLPRGKEANVYRTDDGKIVLNAGRGDDDIKVSRSNSIFSQITGKNVCVEVNGEKYYFTEAEARRLEIHGGSGNDRISVDGNVGIGLNIHGNGGNDTISGGSGNDRIYGGSGDDTIYGGRGNDEIYGGSGDDTIYGGRGSDYVHGGAGDDDIHGGRGDDTLIGGRGDDYLNGGRGSDLSIQDDFFFSRLLNNLRRV